MKLSDEFQKYLPFGYLYLVVMGLFKESIFFFQLGINILKYSSLMDILISPISDLTSHPLISFVLAITLLSVYLFMQKIIKDKNQKWLNALVRIKENENISEEEITQKATSYLFKYIAAITLGFFSGIGIGGGNRIAEKIKNNTIEFNSKLTFNTGETEEVFIIDTNSAYYFYLTKGQKTIKIAPIGAIKYLELSKNKKLDE